jgi:sulfur carrier protein ThiS
MTIILKLKSGLEKYTETSVIEYEMSATKTVLDVLTEMNFPVERTGAVLVDGKLAEKNHKLRGGETVKIFPAHIC